MTVMIYLTNLLRAFSMALELSSGGLSRHHWRTALISSRIATQLGLPFQECRALIHAALLHDIGAASSWEEKNSLRANLPLPDYHRHAEQGYLLLKDSPTLGELACPILHHHDHWDDSDPSGLVKDDIPLISRIINLADTCEILLSNKTFILDQRSQILDVLISKSGTVFDPTLVKALLEVGKQESFWLDLTNPYYYETFFQNLNQFGKVRVSVDDILEFAQIFATIIDRTSTFTANHSRSVAEVSAVLAQAKKYSATEIKMMRIAGLLHDLGKLAVPNAILEKPGKLSAYEYSVIKQHPYYTYHILSQIEGFEIIAEWAAYHHETLDGQGYPFRVEPDQIRLGSRIVAVADIFVALSEHRPYRPPLNRQQVQKIMYDMADHHKLDKELVDDLWQCTELLNSPKLHQLLSFN